MTMVAGQSASSGEVLRIASQIPPGSLEGLYSPYNWFAQQIQTLAESVDPDVDPAGAR